MNISGSIATNDLVSVDEFKKLCVENGVEFYVDHERFSIRDSSIAFMQQLDVEVEFTETAVKYKTFIPELSGYMFLALVALGLLYRIIGLGVWSVVLLGMISVLIGIRVRYDKQLFQLMNRIVPKSARLIPEQAGPDHVAWINNPKVCPACGSPRNEYLNKCGSCGLVLDKKPQKKKPPNHNHTGAQNVEIKYDYTSE